MGKGTQSAANGQLQATIIKKCSLDRHRPESNKQCAGGTCQHTCSPESVSTCRHAWTVVYSANGRQREKSFRDELDDQGQKIPNSGLRKAQDFQLKHTADKRAQGKTYVDPKAADELFTVAAERMILHSARIQGGDQTRKNYLGLLRGDITRAFEGRTLASMATAAAADEVAAFLNVTIAHRSKNRRRVARMIITWTMDEAVNAEKIHRHKLAGISLTEGTAVSRRQQREAESDDDEAGGFVFITDEQVKMLAEGGTFTTPEGKTRTLQGIGIAAWLQRTMGLRIREALGVEKRDFRTRKDGSRYLRLRAQATRDGKGRAKLKHRKEGEGRDVPVPDFVWNMVQSMPDDPLCPGPKGSRYMSYGTAWNRFTALADAMGIEKGFSTHSLRHQFATEALEEDPRQLANISQVLGHQSVETTLRFYVHASADAEKRIGAMMNNRWKVTPGQGQQPKAARPAAVESLPAAA